MAKLEEQIEATKKRLDQLKARQQRIEAQKRADQQKRTRQEDTRRKILLGSAILAQPGMDDEKLKTMVEKFLTKKADRALFGLPEMENAS